MALTNVSLRFASPDDAETIYNFIVQLAIYEREPEAVETNAGVLREQLSSESSPFECLIAERGGIPVGFALFFSSYSTWRGLPGIYLEDLFVPEQYRGSGIGTKLLAELARLTLQRGGARLEWSVLDWNEPSIGFYEHFGAAIRRDWLPCRLSGQALRTLSER
ncbi:MAG: GNAT family N-acetyltransferase [Myxococcales bacterium]|nr:GNAT family N-acetyltransferase [Myxococcales bacterium]